LGPFGSAAAVLLLSQLYPRNQAAPPFVDRVCRRLARSIRIARPRGKFQRVRFKYPGCSPGTASSSAFASLGMLSGCRGCWRGERESGAKPSGLGRQASPRCRCLARGHSRGGGDPNEAHPSRRQAICGSCRIRQIAPSGRVRLGQWSGPGLCQGVIKKRVRPAAGCPGRNRE
jgi:hypothetical protein